VPNEDYWNWREKGMKTKDPIRYPAGYKNRRNCLYSIKDKDSMIKLSYIEARKEIYLPIYTDLVRKQKQFEELKERLSKGENLLIIEVDGPHQESLEYYKKKYGVKDDFIEKDTILATEENLKIMLNDDKHSFGHGYCLAAALLDFDLVEEKNQSIKKLKLENNNSNLDPEPTRMYHSSSGKSGHKLYSKDYIEKEYSDLEDF
jgi:hypothetical protein